MPGAKKKLKEKEKGNVKRKIQIGFGNKTNLARFSLEIKHVTLNTKVET